MKQPVRLCLTECIQTKVIDLPNTLPCPKKQTKVTIEDLAIEHSQTRRKEKKKKQKKKVIIKHLPLSKQTKKRDYIIKHLATERSLMQSRSSSRPYIDVQSDSR